MIIAIQPHECTYWSDFQVLFIECVQFVIDSAHVKYSGSGDYKTNQEELTLDELISFL